MEEFRFIKVSSASSLDIILFVITLLFTSSIPSITAFPQGGPTESCDSLLPRHVGTHPLEAEKSPYFLVQSTNRYGDEHGAPIKGIKGERLREISMRFLSVKTFILRLLYLNC